jgi:hypothetical protein
VHNIDWGTTTNKIMLLRIFIVAPWPAAAVDDANAAVQGLNSSDTLHELVTVATADGTTQVIDVTINGANDAAVITGASTAELTETNAIQSTGGTLSATDADGSAAFVVQTDVAGGNGFGKFFGREAVGLVDEVAEGAFERQHFSGESAGRVDAVRVFGAQGGEAGGGEGLLLAAQFLHFGDEGVRIEVGEGLEFLTGLLDGVFPAQPVKHGAPPCHWRQ